MSAYFPLPPSISIKENTNKIIGSLTFLNYPNNRLNSIIKKRNYKDDVYLGIYFFRNQNWHLLEIKKCNPMEFLEIYRSDLDVDDHEMVVAIPKKLKSFKKNYRNLPEPDLLKIDNSIVAQRASLNFSYLDSKTSYQGEYPYKMSILKKSSLLTFDTLKQNIHKSVRNFLILMNISIIKDSLSNLQIKSFDPNNVEKFEILNAKRNSFTIFETSSYEKRFVESSTIFLTSKEATFIPLILSLDLNTKQLSVEHTHPPTEYFFGNKKRESVNLIKKEWIN